ncbi:MAG: hypothetical protein NXH78_13170 [Hyphomonadaceae bacterium]|nr:hypothetical protein [Hyphomonadaceae bacterium]
MTLTEYIHEVFSGDGSPVYFNADFGREFVVAIFIFFIGWASSRRASRSQMKARLIDELVLAQRELFKRAYPDNWNEDDVREYWMLSPFVDRISFVIFNFKNEGRLRASQIGELENYLGKTESFIALWARVKRRNIKYDESYAEVFASLISFLESTSPRQVNRIRDLSRRASGNGNSIEPNMAPAA